MFTEQSAIESARQGYRAMFQQMAASGCAWNLHKTSNGVGIYRAGESLPSHMELIVPNVHAMAEQTMVNALSAALRRIA